MRGSRSWWTITGVASRIEPTSSRMATSGSGAGRPRTSMWMPSGSVQRAPAPRALAGAPGSTPRAPPAAPRSDPPLRVFIARSGSGNGRVGRLGQRLQQPLRQHGGDLPAVVRLRDRGAHRADLFLDQLAQRGERLVVGDPADERVGAGE